MSSPLFYPYIIFFLSHKILLQFFFGRVPRNYCNQVKGVTSGLPIFPTNFIFRAILEPLNHLPLFLDKWLFLLFAIIFRHKETATLDFSRIAE